MNKYSSEEFEDVFSGKEEDDYSSVPKQYEDISSGKEVNARSSRSASAQPTNANFEQTRIVPHAKPQPASAQSVRRANPYVQNNPNVYAKEGNRAPSGQQTPAFEDIYSEYQTPDSRKPRRGQGGNGARKKGKKAKKIIAVILIVVLLIAGVFCFFGYPLISKINYVPSEHANLYLDSNKLMSNRRVKNILFIGCDDDSGGSQRSDSIMLVSIDRIHRKIKLTSFMRDTWVYIPDHDYAKLNAAYAYGGAGLLMDTIEYNFGVKIDSYALVDFDIFASIIDELGGVEVEVTEKEADFINENTSETVKAGKTTLNGDEALVYCRIRYLDSDFMRTQRQRKVMTSIVDKAKHSGIFTMYKLADVILPQVKTDITKWEMLGIGLGALGYLTYDVEQMRIPVDDSYTSEYFGDQQALSIDFDKNKAELRKFIYEDSNN